MPAAEVPAGRQERIAWLYEWWERIDTWIEGHHEPGVPSSPLPAPGDRSDDG